MTRAAGELYYGWWIVAASFSILLITVGILGVVTISATLGAATGPVSTARIFDVTGSYEPAFILHIASFTAGAVAICFLRRPGLHLSPAR